MTEKSYIWTLPTRVFHILFALSITFAYLLNEGFFLSYHVIFGYLALYLVLFRIVWGLIGPKYSKFKDFPISKDAIKEFLYALVIKPKSYTGHNPLASIVMIAILISVILTTITGILTFGIQEGKGLLGFLNLSFFKEMDFFKEIHEFFANVTLLFIVIHLIGIFVDKVIHKNDTVFSIFTGYKTVRSSLEIIKLNLFQKLLSILFFVGFIVLSIFLIIVPKNIFTSSIYTPINYKFENITFVNECASCHMLYPPQLFPKYSWEIIMENLEDHFGDDASLDNDTKKNIKHYLINNSGENSTKQMSLIFLNSIGKEAIIDLTKTKAWKKIHKEIDPTVFDTKEVRSKANCKACHSDIENGLLENEKIKRL